MKWLLRFWRRKQLEEQLDKEMLFHLEQRSAALAAAGHSPREAARLARLEFGGLDQAKEDCRDARGTRWLHDFLQDLRYAARNLRSHPGFAAVGATALALGIGAATAIFSAVNPILFEPLPYPQASRILMIWDMYQGARSAVTFHTYRELAARTRSFENMAAFEPWQPTLSGSAQPERLTGQSVSAAYFPVLGVMPALGRAFSPADTRPHGPHVTILGDGLWRRRFHSDPAIVGRQITLDGDLYTVIGVMPRAFDNVLQPSAELWAPMQYDPASIFQTDSSAWGHHLQMIGRLRPGVGVDRARRELNGIASAPVRDFPRPAWAALRYGLIVNALQDEVARGVRPVLVAVLAAVALLLLIASVNVTNLLLARGAQRRAEFSMRTALGAARSRLIRQVLAESLLLAAAGGALGLIVAQLGIEALVALSPAGLPRLTAVRLDAAVFAFAFVITALAGIAVGVIPALAASHVDPAEGIRQGARQTPGARQTVRSILAISEVALALILLAGAGLLLRSLHRLFAIPPGFAAAHVLTMQVQFNGHAFDSPAARQRFLARSLDAVRRIPEVDSAAFTSLLPLSGDPPDSYGAHFEDGRAYDIYRYAVTPGYIRLMGIPLRRGRMLDSHDGAGAAPVALLSESLAKKQFPGQDPIGRRLHIGPMNRPFYTVVGVVGDVRQSSLADTQLEAVYLTPEQSWFADNAMSLVVRARANAAALVPAVEQAVWSIDKDQPIIRIAALDDLLSKSASERRFALIVFESFALVALILAATGIYGVLSGQVSERFREIGVRAALGASRRNLLGWIMGRGIALAAIGIAIGIAGASAATGVMTALLYGTSRLDPLTYGAVAALLLAVAALACWLPARRASRVDPAITLRSE